MLTIAVIKTLNMLPFGNLAIPPLNCIGYFRKLLRTLFKRCGGPYIKYIFAPITSIKGCSIVIPRMEKSERLLASWSHTTALKITPISLNLEMHSKIKSRKLLPLVPLCDKKITEWLFPLTTQAFHHENKCFSS